VFIRRLAHDFSSNGKLTQRHLADLGIPEAQHKAFVQFVLTHPDGMPTQLNGPQGELYAQAVRTFTRQSIMAPSSTHKPRYMSSPLGRIIGQLQSFNYALYENVIKRVGRMAKEGAVGKDYTLSERAQLVTPALMVPLLWAGAYALGEGRDALFGDPNRREEMSGTDKAIRAVSRGSPIAPIDPAVNYATSARYRTDAAKFAAGPVLGSAFTGMDAARDVFFTNAEGTNTQERKAMKAVYDIFIEPAANLAIGMTPVSPVSAIATQVVGSGGVREAFVSSAAGEAKKKGGSTGRDSGRDGGRSSGRDSGR
jgi:hypothetical protein